MYKQCRTEQSAQRQRQLLEGMLEVMLQQHYDEITVSDLCQRIGIPRKSFYRYFSSKEGALNALIDHALLDFESFAQSHRGRSEDQTLRELEWVFAYWLHRKKLLDALAKSGLSGILVYRAIQHSILETVGERKYLPPEEQEAQRYLMLYTVSGLMSMVIQWHHEGFPQSVEQMARIAVRLGERPMEGGLFP